TRRAVVSYRKLIFWLWALLANPYNATLCQDPRLALDLCRRCCNAANRNIDTRLRQQNHSSNFLPDAAICDPSGATWVPPKKLSSRSDNGDTIAIFTDYCTNCRLLS